MKVALDFDGTVTANKDMWRDVVRTMVASGADVRIVTYRSRGFPGKANTDITEWVRGTGLLIPVMFTGGVQKAHACESMNWIPDIWIDDNPTFIVSEEEMVIRLDECEKASDYKGSDLIQDYVSVIGTWIPG